MKLWLEDMSVSNSFNRKRSISFLLLIVFVSINDIPSGLAHICVPKPMVAIPNNLSHNENFIASIQKKFHCFYSNVKLFQKKDILSRYANKGIYPIVFCAPSPGTTNNVFLNAKTGACFNVADRSPLKCALNALCVRQFKAMYHPKKQNLRERSETTKTAALI